MLFHWAEMFLRKTDSVGELPVMYDPAKGTSFTPVLRGAEPTAGNERRTDVKYLANMRQIASNQQLLVDIRVLADYLGISPDTVYTMVSQRRIPYVKVGRLLRFDLKVIEEWIKQKTIMPMPEKRA